MLVKLAETLSGLRPFFWRSALVNSITLASKELSVTVSAWTIEGDLSAVKTVRTSANVRTSSLPDTSCFIP